jgi:hypothetical protein
MERKTDNVTLVDERRGPVTLVDGLDKQTVKHLHQQSARTARRSSNPGKRQRRERERAAKNANGQKDTCPVIRVRGDLRERLGN